MQADNISLSRKKWAITVRLFHWLGALLILSAWMTAEVFDNMSLHRSIGISILLWMAARLINRFLVKAPPAPVMPKWQTGMSHLAHTGLYLSMLAMPISGLLMMMYADRETHFFNLFTVPVLVTPNDEYAELFEKLHNDIWWVILLFLLGMHVVGALYHQFIQKDGLIKRML
ncbi:cytochrome b [Acinetobacter sp. c1-l78]|uniref:cytochrome b n=1 Tax=Acinetobacter sp. c1-l78 TaxID=3342803 RepID=UPI0035BAB4C6